MSNTCKQILVKMPDGDKMFFKVKYSRAGTGEVSHKL